MMSDRTPLLQKSSFSSNDSVASTKKRKSVEPDGENRSPNLKDKEAADAITKKTKTLLRQESTSSTAGKTDSRKTSLIKKSALPRYATRQSRSAMETRRTAAESRANERELSPMRNTILSTSTPVKSGLTSSSTPGTAPRSATSRRRKSLLRLSTGGKIKGFFERVNIVDETKINDMIMPKLRTKNKWDYKDKTKKQVEVISELKNTIMSTIEEFKTVKDNCIVAEKSLEEKNRDLRQQLQDEIQVSAELRRSEASLKKEYIRISNEFNATVTQLQAIQKEIVPLKASLKASEDMCRQLEVQYAEEKANRTRADELCSKQQEELVQLRSTSEKNNEQQRVQFEQHMEQTVRGYKDQVENLREQLQRRDNDFERSNLERSELDRRAAASREEFLQTQSALREAEKSLSRLEKDEEKYKAEAEALKKQLMQKEEDLRSTLASLQDVQRTSSEEKSMLRAELSVMQPRLQALEEERLNITSQLATKREEVISLNRELLQAKETITSLQEQVLARDQELLSSKQYQMQLEIERELRIKSETREESEKRERIAACAQLLATQADCNYRIKDMEDKMQGAVGAVRAELERVEAAKEAADAECRRQLDIVASMTGELAQLKDSLEHAEANHEAVEKLSRVSGEAEMLRRQVAELIKLRTNDESSTMARIRSLEEQLAAGEAQRRKLHNTIQELRGNVRVFARVRPFLPNDGAEEAETAEQSTIAAFHDSNSLCIRKQKTTPDGRAEEHAFNFDTVFGPSSSQEVVFDEVKEFVQSALDGYNVCIFSYGQTGAGKTHTMQGSGTGPMRGIIPRAMQQVGKYKTELESKGWLYKMEVSFIEIYNETIKDLLRVNDADDLKHDVKRDAAGNVFVNDVVMRAVDPNNESEIDDIMQQAARFRSVGQTAMNERSSRSHSVFTLHLTASNAERGVALKGALSLVDLAGSERLDRSGATGERMKETLAINKSLSSLTDVFVALANKQSHIPYRNSKLTHLLQPALSGDGKTLMMVNLSPTEESYYESLCSLRFASQVNQCELGKPKRQIKDASSAAAADCAPASTKTVSAAPASSLNRSASSVRTARPTLKASASASETPTRRPSKLQKTGK